MNNKHTYTAWILVAAAVVAWGATLWFAWSISSAETQHASDIANAQQSAATQSTSVRMHAIASDTAPARAQLDQLLTTDVVSIANLLNGLGKTTGVAVKLSGALPEVAPRSAQNGLQIQAVGFTLQADGTFSALMRTAELIETLPLASSLSHLDIQWAPNAEGTGGSWHMDVYIRVYTTSNISS